MSSTEYDHEDNALVSAYTANALNQYAQRTVPGYAGVRGTATNTATVTVNGNPVWRYGDYFYGGDVVDNSMSAVMKQLAVTAVYNPDGTNDPDVVTSHTGRVFVAQTPEAFQYDSDGNLTQDGRFTYIWDGENRLIGVTTRDDLPANVARVRVAYTYDHQSRRIASAISTWTNDAWQAIKSRAFLYDGWNVIRETVAVGSGSPQSVSTNLYTWGLDLSGSIQGAGGIGGLLASVLTTNEGQTVCAAYGFDANGNVTVLAAGGTDESFVLASSLEHDPFGRIIAHRAAPGHEPLAAANRYRFSTKWQDPLTRLSDYGFRWYDAERGRWTSRDPLVDEMFFWKYTKDRNQSERDRLKKEALLPLYAFVRNGTINTVDPHGLFMGWGYGRYCGWSRYGPGRPIDPVDAACAFHDDCLQSWWRIFSFRCCNLRFCGRVARADCSSSPDPSACRRAKVTILAACALPIFWWF